MAQLGGKQVFFSVNDLQLGRGEPIEDTSKVLSSMVDGLVLRTMNHKTQEEFALNSAVPIINGLSDKSHPCQILADLLTFKEEKGEIEGKKLLGAGTLIMFVKVMQKPQKFLISIYGFVALKNSCLKIKASMKMLSSLLLSKRA